MLFKSNNTGGINIGGLIGSGYHATIENCNSTGIINGNRDDSGIAGGLIANLQYSLVKHSYSSCEVTGDGVLGAAGGLIGSTNNSTITSCYSTGNVSGGHNVGGLIGDATFQTSINNSYSTSTVNGDNGVGGLVGRTEYTCEINNCFSTGNVIGNTCIGGFLGWDSPSYPATGSGNYYSQEAYSQGVGYGPFTGVEGKSIAEIQALYSTMGFTEANGWMIYNGDPHFIWENLPITVKSSNTLADLGFTSNVTFVLPNSTKTFSTSTTLQEVLDSIKTDSAVTNAELIDGVILITTTNASLNLTSGFMSNFNATQTSSTTTTTNTTTTPIEYTTTNSNTTTVPWEYTTVKENYTTTTELVTTTSTTTQIETIFNTTTVALTGSNTFGNLGVTNLKVTVIGEGTRSVLSINENTTFDEFYAMLLTNNIETSQSGGTITFTGDGNTYVSSSALTNLFKLGALNKNISQRNANTKSDAQIYTKNLLDELGPIYAPGSLTLQVGVNADSNSQVGVTTAFSLVGYNDFRGIGVDGNNYLAQLDATLEVLNNRQVELGAMQNRLISALDEITVQRENLISSRSTLRDADIADISSEYIRQQILQQASATLLATANQSASIALSLI